MIVIIIACKGQLSSRSSQCNHFITVFYLKMQDKYVNEESRNDDDGPLIMNAFEMITLSQGLNLSALFDRRQV